MIQKNKNSIWIMLLLTLFAISVLFGAFYLAYYNVTEKMAEAERESTLDQKKKMIQYTVDNVIRDIDMQRETLKKDNPELTEEEIENKVVESLYQKVHHDEYADGAYVWVEKVLDYSGGDQYAIRLMHPNLIDTEGKYLSTEDTDKKGNYLYEKELEGVLKDGYVFQTYYFPKFHSDVISKKISYSRLYKDYDWIIAMGVNIDDLDVYMDKFENEVHPYIRAAILIMGTLYFLLFLAGLIILHQSDNRYFGRQRKAIENEVNHDLLTGVFSRKYGDRYIKKVFDEYKKNGNNPVIMIFDIDKFKQYNDIYGHDMGDKVLAYTAQRVQNVIRSSDVLIRWGGDEFVGVFPGLKPHNLPDVKDKILESVRQMNIKDKDSDTVLATISIGFTYFRVSDASYEDAVKRADQALYIAKESGRDRGEIIYE